MKIGIALGLALVTSGVACSSPAVAGSVKPVSAVHDWSGYYIGAQVEGDWMKAQEAHPFNLSDATVWGGGINAQALWQQQNVVFGLAAHANLLGGDNKSGCENGGPALQCRYGSSWDASVRAKLGLALDRFMVYGTGGWGWSDNHIVISNNTSTQTDVNTLGGWVAGGGVAFAIDDHWSTSIEYLHYDLGSANATAQIAFGSVDVRPISDTVTLGFAYKY